MKNRFTAWPKLAPYSGAESGTWVVDSVVVMELLWESGDGGVRRANTVAPRTRER